MVRNVVEMHSNRTADARELRKLEAKLGAKKLPHASEAAWAPVQAEDAQKSLSEDLVEEIHNEQ